MGLKRLWSWCSYKILHTAGMNAQGSLSRSVICATSMGGQCVTEPFVILHKHTSHTPVISNLHLPSAWMFAHNFSSTLHTQIYVTGKEMGVGGEDMALAGDKIFCIVVYVV